MPERKIYFLLMLSTVSNLLGVFLFGYTAFTSESPSGIPWYCIALGIYGTLLWILYFLNRRKYTEVIVLSFFSCLGGISLWSVWSVPIIYATCFGMMIAEGIFMVIGAIILYVILPISLLIVPIKWIVQRIDRSIRRDVYRIKDHNEAVISTRRLNAIYEFKKTGQCKCPYCLKTVGVEEGSLCSCGFNALLGRKERLYEKFHRWAKMTVPGLKKGLYEFIFYTFFLSIPCLFYFAVLYYSEFPHYLCGVLSALIVTGFAYLSRPKL